MKICPRCQELYPPHLEKCPRDSGVLERVLDPHIGRTIAGRYRLIARLGTGGMSSVYLARHVMIDRLMAIKVLRRDLAKDAIQRDRFLREARAVNRINHDNIVEITDTGETDDGLVYLVMEYVPGDSVLKVMGEGPMHVERAFHIVRQIASALARAHEMGIVHRDLKPENVLIVPRRDNPDFVKVLDFGIAKIMDAPSLTGSQQIFGTPGYIAPEYIQSTDIDGRADLYSLGVLLYELITGALPFDYEYPGDLLVKHVTEQPIPPRERHADVAPAVEALILRCLVKDPAARFRDAFHFIEELDRVWETVGSPNSWGGLDEQTAPGADGWGEEVEVDGSMARQTLIDGPFQPVARLRETQDHIPPASSDGAGAETEVEPVEDVSEGAVVAEEGRRATRGFEVAVDVVLGGAAAEESPTPPLQSRGGRKSHPTAEYGRPAIPTPPAVAAMEIPVEVAAAGNAPSEAPPARVDPERDGLLGVKKWRARYDVIRGCLDELEPHRPSPPNVMQAMAAAARSLDALESELREVAVMQARLEALDEEARDFRSTLGKAIDTLAGRLSTSRGAFEALVNRRNRLRTRLAALRKKARAGVGPEGDADAILWELAAIEEKVDLEASRCDATEVQVSELRAQLDGQNETVEREMGEIVATLADRMSKLEAVAHALRDPLATVETYVVDAWPTEEPS